MQKSKKVQGTSRQSIICIIIYAIISCIILYITENIIHPNYFYSTILKLILFIVLPIIWLKYLKIKGPTFGKINKRSFKYGLSVGILASVVMIIAFYFLNGLFDWENIKAELAGKGVNSTTFIFVFAYIMFGNSLVEEFFFRGFIFNFVKKYRKITAYIFSSLLFSVYHIFIFGTWFDGILIAICLFGLFVGGLFFAYLYEKTAGIWATYIFHILVDSVIMIIGFLYLFN